MLYEMLKAKRIGDSGGGGSQPTLITKSIGANGSYSASDDSADGYSQVSVSVPNSYTAGDEGKVVQSGALVAQTATSTTTNGTIDTTTNNSVVVNVANTYTAADEGKVVSNGELVSQTSSSVTQNGTVDTTLINSLVVNVPTAGQITSLVKLEPYQNNCVSDLYIGTMITSGIECWFLIGSIELLETPYSYLYLTVPSTFDTSKINYIDKLGTSKIYGSSVSSLNWIHVNYDSTNQLLSIRVSGSGYFVSGNKYSITGMNAI